MGNLSKESIHVFAPATVANVSCGFDIFGFALEKPGDRIILRLKDKPGIVISKITGDNNKLPIDPTKNTVSVSIQGVLNHIGSNQGLDIEVHKEMPLGSGLGSSAASSVGGVFAINKLLNINLKPIEVLPFAMQGEAIACGSAHADNVAPSLMGGFVLVRSYFPLDVVKLPTPKTLSVTVIHPHIEIRTEDARSILRKEVTLEKAVKQWGNIAGLATGLVTENYGLISRSMQDVIIEPVRSILIPGYDEIKENVLEAGAIGCGISGSGPSIFAFSKGKEKAQEIANIMQSTFKNLNIESKCYVSEINQQGPIILD